jgi:putative ABC transport system permease protein
MKRLFRLPFSRDRMRRDVDAELSFHLEGRIDELVARGMTRADAEIEAARRFGNRELVEAEVEQIDLATNKRRNMRERFDAVVRDARYAVRGLTRRPLYASAVIVTLALAIGANTTIFSVVEAVLLKPFDIPAIGRLAVVRDDFPKMNLRNAQVSPLESIDLFARKDLFSVSAATSGDRITTEIRGENIAVTGAQTLGDFFTLVGARPLLGRLYRPEDSQPGRPQVVVLSYEFWQKLSGDSAIIGRSILFGEKTYEVIGVLPPSIAYPRVAMYWRPMVLDPDADYMKDRGYLTELFVGRMRDGMTLERLRTELRSTAEAWHAAAHGNYGQGGHTLITQSFVDYQAGQLKPITVALFAAVVFVLLIACANVASLQLVRAAGRAREIAVRAALGAGRAAIARQLIVESGLLAIGGGVVGIAMGWAGLRALSALDLSRFPALKALHLDSAVLAFTAGTVAVAGIAFGTAPVLRAARADVNDGLRDSGRASTGGIGQHRFLHASVVAQYALTLLLLTGAALTIKSLDTLMRADPGFVAENVVTLGATIPSHRYPTPDARYAFFSQVRARLGAIPGVQAVGVAAGVPFASGFGSTHYQLPDIPQMEAEPQRHANQGFVSGDYFKALGIQIVRGHTFTEEEYSSGRVLMIIDENLARQSFGSRDPIGARIEHGMDGTGTIVGVARAVKTLDLSEPAHPMIYHAAAQSHFQGGTIIVRSTLSTDQIAKLARGILLDLEPKVIVGNPKALSTYVTESLGPRRLATNVMAGFAALSLVLALLGVYAVMSYVVSQRTKEIGIRVALGAQRGEVAGMVLRDGATLALTGLAIGGVALIALARLVQSLLYGVSVFDPLAIGASIALLGGITAIACYFPARRAVRVDPVITLRSE